jgi:hypothetical protein
MAKVIQFYVPKNSRNSFMPAAQPGPGKIIEFHPVAKKAVPAQLAGGVLTWLLEGTESNRGVGSESPSHPGVA